VASPEPPTRRAHWPLVVVAVALIAVVILIILVFVGSNTLWPE
jgi:hypothetical protein